MIAKSGKCTEKEAKCENDRKVTTKKGSSSCSSSRNHRVFCIGFNVPFKIFQPYQDDAYYNRGYDNHYIVLSY